MKRPAPLIALLALTLLTTGCGRDAKEEFDRAESLFGNGKYEQALRAYRSAAEKADEEALSALSGQIQDRIARFTSAVNEDAAEHMRLAQTRAAAHDWPGMLNALSEAERALDFNSDHSSLSTSLEDSDRSRHLRHELETAYDSETVGLARTARVYAKMSREARWSNWQHWLGGDDWFTYWSEASTSELGNHLTVEAGMTGNRDLVRQAGEVATSWDRYWSAKVISRNNQDRERTSSDDPAWVQILDAAIDVGVAVNEVYSGAKFDEKRRAFETTLNGSLATATFPELDLDESRPATTPDEPESGNPVVARAPIDRSGDREAGPVEDIHADDVGLIE